MTDELIALSAVEAVRRLRRREVRPIDLVDPALARVAEVEPAGNAMPTARTPPCDVNQRCVTVVAGHESASYMTGCG